jgi:protein-S-isoprenylcysteine O-methyltransferase Ste14
VTPLRGAFEKAGHFLFRTRNALFPAAFAATLALFPPPGERMGRMAAGLALVALGQGLRVVTIGFRYVKRGGKEGRIYADGLVTGGVFAHCRNPMYVGNLLVVLGLLGAAGNPMGIAVGGAFFLLAYVAIVLAEETYLLGRFGDEYRAYCARVPRFVPNPGGVAATLRPLRFDWKRVVSKEHGTLYLNVMLALGVLAYAGHDRAPLLGIALVATAAYGLARVAKKKTAWLRAA